VQNSNHCPTAREAHSAQKLNEADEKARKTGASPDSMRHVRSRPAISSARRCSRGLQFSSSSQKVVV
jgi:hypothetical protein